ncbi:class I SAM-dependent methyltransferase [Aurantiacibacter gangjinensis]|uniref:class I SAM-dependent methyltransferase n=1 Tax=Aurantiacibacter gangjinensis TaxID=502682 RepID=UPI00090A4084|nr:class I SAM-dependent methyltransferase [Aurantiacibacter gangjinensis]APE27091.1 hypothetical protein BMF35_a0262 [Aurantiacibacter gangjinensis]
MRFARRLVDIIAAIVVTLGAPLFRAVGNWPGNFPLYRRQADRAGMHWRSTHYYHPTYRDADLPADVTSERELPGLDLNEAGQLALLDAFECQSELAALTEHAEPELAYAYDNLQFNAGDADALYAMIRHARPNMLIEIGSGHSTRVAAKAIARNRETGALGECRHVCTEPYEMPWLETLGPEILRQKVEDVPRELFDALGEGDILFIDSSHVIRPFGDVTTELLQIVPRLAKGVLVHVHDIFTPRDYPERWLRRDRRLWNEQYLLEAMLAHSPRYRVCLALNWLKHNHGDALERAFPILEKYPDAQPGSFWFEVAQ